MLQFVLGRAGSGKTEYMRRLLADRALAGQGGTVMLVPEQYTFETEKAMLRLAGRPSTALWKRSGCPGWMRPARQFPRPSMTLSLTMWISLMKRNRSFTIFP